MSTDKTQDVAEIRRLIEDWAKALEAKDADGLVANYAEDAHLFDACPPYKTVGRENIRKLWEHCFPFFPDSFRSEHRDLEIHASGDLAFVYGLHHFIPEDPGHPCGQSWMRVTACYERQNGRWLAVHEHVSMPFNPMTNEMFAIKDPDKPEAPDYSGMSE